LHLEGRCRGVWSDEKVGSLWGQLTNPCGSPVFDPRDRTRTHRRVKEPHRALSTWRTSAWNLEDVGVEPQPKSAGLPGITRQRVGLPLKIFQLNSLLLLPLAAVVGWGTIEMRPGGPLAATRPFPTNSYVAVLGRGRARVGDFGSTRRRKCWYSLLTQCRHPDGQGYRVRRRSLPAHLPQRSPQAHMGSATPTRPSAGTPRSPAGPEVSSS